MLVKLTQTFVIGIIATIGAANVTAGASYYRAHFESPFNATSWHTTMPLQPRCVSIVIEPQHTTFSATRNVRYTILGVHGVRLVDAPGAVAFFEEAPTGNYTIISNGVRMPYRHTSDDKQTWRPTLTNVLMGHPQVIERPASK